MKSNTEQNWCRYQRNKNSKKSKINFITQITSNSHQNVCIQQNQRHINKFQNWEKNEKRNENKKYIFEYKLAILVIK